MLIPALTSLQVRDQALPRHTIQPRTPVSIMRAEARSPLARMRALASRIPALVTFAKQLAERIEGVISHCRSALHFPVFREEPFFSTDSGTHPV